MNSQLIKLYESVAMPILMQSWLKRLLYRGKWVNGLYLENLIYHTKDFSGVTWLGKPIWQSILDLWVIQETIYEIKPELLIECGTNRGGSAYYYAQLFELMRSGEVITIDTERMHDLKHPRITFMIGDSVAEEIVDTVRRKAETINGPVMVILDSDHSAKHVIQELRLYAPFVTVNSYCLVEDGIMDIVAPKCPGPVNAIKTFLSENDAFIVDHQKCDRFLVTHHPLGWLKRVS